MESNMGKFAYLLVALGILVSGSVVVQSVEHSYLTRGYNCEAIYIQARVDTAKSLDLIIDKYKEKEDEYAIKYLEKIKKYQIYVAELPGETRNCVNIEKTFLELVYLNIKNMLR